MSFRLWEIAKDPDKREALKWLGGVLVAVAVATWTIFTFVVEHKDVHDKDGRQTGQVVAEAQRPLLERNEKLAAENAKLTLQLEQARKGPQPPGAQQAVGAAVGSIAQGAAEGDARLQHALDLLKENKIAEATPLLNAVAEDKSASAERATARAAKDRKDAAIAYRNLGAIAGLADPKRALEAYEKAVALDPDDLESLFWAGWIEIDYGDLNKAQARLERVLTLAKTDDQALYKYRALTGLGDIKEHRGGLEGELKSYNDSLAIVARLAKSDPGNAEWQRDLSVSYNKVGDVQKAQGDLTGALKSYQVPAPSAPVENKTITH